MSAIALKAHYDGKQILLDEQFDLPVNSRLIITVLPFTEENHADAWSTLASQSLVRAYSDTEPEYSLEDIKA